MIILNNSRNAKLLKKAFVESKIIAKIFINKGSQSRKTKYIGALFRLLNFRKIPGILLNSY